MRSLGTCLVYSCAVVFTLITRRRRLSLLVKIEGDPLNTQHRRMCSLLVKIEVEEVVVEEVIFTREGGACR